VLIIDEDRELCRGLTGALCKAGCQVECLTTRESHFQAVRELAPDLVVLDVSLPEAHGLETLRQLETHRSTRRIPVIVTSRHEELEYELLDAFDFLPKPLDERRLLEDIALLAQSDHPGRAELFPSMGEKDLALFQNFLVTHSGLHFDQRNIRILERGLMRRMRAVGVRDYAAYHRYLEKYGESRQELKKLLGLLTVGETYFFRYLAHFEALIRSVLPELLARHDARRTLRIWSAGCSTGEEPYSIAMVLLEHFPQLADWNIHILGTDINKRALRRAREGVYGVRALRVTDPLYREKYFQQVGSSYVLDPRVRNLVRFSYLNLQTGAFPATENGTAEIDLLFCRNVMIYFGIATTRRIVERFVDCLRPEGYLFLGHAETLSHISDCFQRLQQGSGFYYRLRGEQEPPVETPRPARAAPPIPPPRPQPVMRAPEPPPRPAAPPAPPPAPDLAELFARGEQEYNRENFKTASQCYDTILRHAPQHVGALVGKGFILANEGRYGEALDRCALALEIDDLCPAAYFLRGLILELSEDPVGALAEYRKALLLDMGFIMPHYNLSKVFWRLGRAADARRELKNTIRLLERAADEAIIPYSGGLSRAVFLEVCREDATQFGDKR
jgi:chemotaxis protein methyltransferase CheR